MHNPGGQRLAGYLCRHGVEFGFAGGKRPVGTVPVDSQQPIPGLEPWQLLHHGHRQRRQGDDASFARLRTRGRQPQAPCRYVELGAAGAEDLLAPAPVAMSSCTPAPNGPPMRSAARQTVTNSDR